MENNQGPAEGKKPTVLISLKDLMPMPPPESSDEEKTIITEPSEQEIFDDLKSWTQLFDVFKTSNFMI